MFGGGITAEYRGSVGKRTGRFADDSPDEFDDEESNGLIRNAIRSGRIIMLGDGSEVLTDSDDAAMFDDEQKDEKDDEALSKKTANQEESKSADTEMKDSEAEKPTTTAEVKKEL